jgi:hypothetical protein
MKLFFKVFMAIVLLSLPASAQQQTFQDPLLDHLVGTWVLRGTIAEGETTHDIACEWALGHQYVSFNEVSREKNAAGQAEYEAIVFIGWDQALGQYACLWLDNTGGGGLTGQAIGHAKRDGDAIPFRFMGANGSVFLNTFRYSKESDAWEWRMEGEENGKMQPFALVKLTKK